MQTEILDVLRGLQSSMERLEAKVQAIDERTQTCSIASQIPGTNLLETDQGQKGSISLSCSDNHHAHFPDSNAALSACAKDVQRPRQRMLATYKQLCLGVPPAAQHLQQPGQAVAEGQHDSMPIGGRCHDSKLNEKGRDDCKHVEAWCQGTELLGEGIQDSKLIEAEQRIRELPRNGKRGLIARLCGAKEEPEGHQGRDPPDKEATKLTPEREMWGILKESEFYRNMHISVSTGRALPLIDWLRMLLQIPSHIRVKELVRIFDEEDTVTALATVVPPTIEGVLAVPHMILLAVMHPSSAVRTSWDTYVLALLFSVCIITPYMICFDVTTPVFSLVGVWETTMDASFMLDVFLNFRTAFLGSNHLVTEAKAIALHYLKGFFTIDVLSTIPWDIVLTNETLGLVQLFKATKMIKLVRIIRVLKLVRILRLLKAPTVIRHLEVRMGRVAVRIGSLVCIVIFILHLFACLFHSVAMWNESTISWVEASGIVNQNSQVDRYVTSMYWAMSTMATVGYGDVTPVHFSEKIVAMVGMLVGVTIFAYIMSTVSSLLSTFNAQTLRAKETQRQLDSFCRAHKLPTNLARKLGTYYDYVLPRTVHSEDLALVSGLSAALRQQVLLTLHAQLFDKIPFFRDQPAQFLQHLLPELKLEYYAASEYVLWQGDISTEMYFITQGMLEVRVDMDPSEVEEAQKELEYSALGTGNKRVDMVQHAANLWRRRDQNPHLHRRPAEEKGGRNHRRPYIRPLQQIHKPLSLLTHAIRHAVNTTTTSAASMFGAAPATPAHNAVAGNGVQRSTGARRTGCGSFSSGSEKSARGGQSAASVKAPRSVCFASSTEGRQDPESDDMLKSQPVAEGQASLSENPARTTVPVPERVADGPEASTHDVHTAVDLATVSSSSQRLRTEFYQDSTELQSLDELIGPCADRMPLAAESIGALNQAHTIFQTSSTTGEFVGQTMAVENRESEDIGREGTDPLLSPGGYAHCIEDRQTADSLWKTAKHASGNTVVLPDSKTTTDLVQRMIGIQGAPFRRVGKLGPGQYFGEMACWTGEKRSASVVTITTAELYCLQRSTLQAAAKLWPDLEFQLSQPHLRPNDECGPGELALCVARKHGYTGSSRGGSRRDR